MSGSKFLRRKEASRYLKDNWGVDRAPATLAKLAVIGGGPTFRRIGRVPLYEPDCLDQWAESKLGPRLKSTSDKGFGPDASAAQIARLPQR